eukprot:scaffold603_cov118-Cylindrotheca_fusiformis.AAC.5
MSLDLEQQLLKRKDDVSQRKAAEQNEIQKDINKLPKRPRDSLEALDKKIDSLERERTITSISLAEERQILKEINFVKKSQSQIEEYDALEKQIQEKKTAITSLRESLKIHTASLSEIEAALAKVRLANKLGCSTQELTTDLVECPRERIGAVIGKKGSMIKKIEAETKVNINVEKDTNKIMIEGNQESIDMANAEIDKLIRRTEDEVDVPARVLTYLGEKHISAIQDLREENVDVTIDILRKTGKLTVRGIPERVEEVRETILGLDVTTKEKRLDSRELSIVIGKKGGRIKDLVVNHSISIDVEKSEKDENSMFLTGPPRLVDAALSEIDMLLSDNLEVEEKIHVDLILKRILIHNKGQMMKTLQRKINDALGESNGSCVLSFDSEHQEKIDALLVVKARQAIVSAACELTKGSLKDFDSLVRHTIVDPYIVPRIIGKNGEIVRKLTEGKPCFLELSRTTGSISLGATTVDGLNSLEAEINEFLIMNSVERVHANAETMKAQYREFTRSKFKAEINTLASVDLDTKNKCFIILGKKDSLEKAKEMMESYLVSNVVDEIPVAENDFIDLVSGGRGGLIVRLSNELKAHLRGDRDRKVVVIKGTEEEVRAAKSRLDQFLNGGDGHSVAKISVTASIVGGIIGKGGKNRQQLEKKHGVSVHISDSNVVAIRGPETSVAECKIEVLKMVATARVSQSLSLTEDQQKSLENSGALKRIMREVPSHVTVADGSATVRGFFYDVRDAVALLNEQLRGEYRSSIELERSQFTRVKATARDPSHFERIGLETNTTISVNSDDGSVCVSGKRSDVKKAKDQLFGFFSFVLPAEIERMKIAKPLQASVGQATSLAEIAATVGGATLYLDRDLGSIVIRSTDTSKVERARRFLQEAVEEAEKLIYVLQLKPADSWLLPVVVGKNGTRVSSLEKDSGCKLDISKEARTVTIQGETEDKVTELREKITKIIEKARRENYFFSVPDAAIAAFMGKGASHIKKFSTEYGVDIQRLRKGKEQFKISGDEGKIESVKGAIGDWISSWEESRANIQIPVDKQCIAAVLGTKGETALSIEKEFDCRVDVDRTAMIVTLRGGTEAKRQAALERIEAIITKEKEAKTEALLQRKTPLSLQESKDEEKPSKPLQVSNPSSRGRVNSFPAVPVGVSAPSVKKKNGSTCMEAGTPTGRSLLRILVDDPGQNSVR